MKNKKIKRDFFFKLKTEEFNWIFIPLAFVFIISLGGFIATSFWSVDLASAKFFEKGMQYEVVKYWTQFYSALGNTELLVILFLLIMVLIESLYVFKAKKRPTSAWKTHKESIWWIYGVFLVFWIAVNIYQVLSFNWTDKGFGKGFDNEIMDSFKYKQVGKSVAFVLQTIILVWGSLYIRFKLSKRNDFLEQEYWIDAIKAITFFILTYLIVGGLKWVFGRPYLYNIEFKDLLDKLKLDEKNSWRVDYYEHQSQFQWGFGPHHDLGSDQEWPWWKLNGFFVRPSDSPQFPLPINYAFPSGHVNATYCTGAIFYLFLGTKKGRKMGIWTKTILVIFFLHLLSMNFAVVVMRWHWVSDVTFTNVLAIIAYPTINLIVDLIKEKYVVKKYV